MPAQLRRVADAEVITNRDARTVRILLAHELLDTTWSRYEAGEEGPDPHVHRLHVDAFFVLEGELVFELGGFQRIGAPAGTFVAIPQNVVHTFRNESDGHSVFLNFHAPSGGFADNLRARREGREIEWDNHEPPADGGRDPADAVVSPPGAGERFGRELRTLTIKAELTELSAIESVFEHGWEGVDPHVHPDHLDSFFVLGGEGDFLHDDETTRAGAGTFVALPPGVRHGFRIPGPEALVVLNVHAPDGGFAGGVRRG